jgi:putative ATP-binding cassette transporter
MTKSRLIHILSSHSKPVAKRLAFLASIAGIFQALVVVAINTASQDIERVSDFSLLLMCGLSIVAFVVCKRMTLCGSMEYAYEIVYAIRLRLVDKIRRAGLQDFESLGQAHLLNTLNQSIEIMIEAVKSASHAASAAVMLVCSFIYVFILSPIAFVMTVGLLLGGTYIYLSTNKKIGPILREASRVDAKFQGFVHHILYGFKELKVHQAKSDDLYHNTLLPNSGLAQEKKLSAEILYIKNNLFVQIFFLVLIAAVVFILPQLAVFNTVVLRDLIAVLLFCIGSIVSVVQLIPLLAKADSALADLERLEAELDWADDMQKAKPGGIPGDLGFSRIELNSIAFRYQSSQAGNGFYLGPMHLSFEPGEIIFLTGGNGSGKSTLLKLIAGLYYPDSGNILWDGAMLDPVNWHRYRNLFSVIFTDFHLFDRLYGLGEVDPEAVSRLLKQVGLDQHTSFEEGRFSKLNLSTGQRKRLALVAACLEKRPIMIFDEVAADQDPEFRDYFYTTLLEEFKAQGKTVIAATHDDRYFQVADRCLKMEFGQLVSRGEAETLT